MSKEPVALADPFDINSAVQEAVAAQLRAMGIDPNKPPAPAPAADRAPNDPAWEREAQAEYEARQPITCRPAPRYLDYLKRRAAAFGETPERHLETILAKWHQMDTWHLQQTATMPTQIGQGAGTGPKL